MCHVSFQFQCQGQPAAQGSQQGDFSRVMSHSNSNARANLLLRAASKVIFFISQISFFSFQRLIQKTMLQVMEQSMHLC
jgi:hypothetical protein